MVTRKDVAERAGVSPATVSHVINRTKYVSPELRQKVEDAIRSLNYVPNMVARSLATKQTRHVGIVVNDITNPYYGEIAQGMEEVAHKNGYMVSLCLMSGEPEEYFTYLLQRQMDGLFITTSEHGFTMEQIESLHNSGVAVVNGGCPDISSQLTFNYSGAIDKLVRYLRDLGHTRIGFLSGLPINSMDPRYTSYLEALKNYGLVYDENLVVDGEYPYHTTWRSGYEAMKRLLNRKTQVTAVFALNDLMAFGAIKAIKEAGLCIPKDISVAGCDDIFFAECTEPALTTLRVPKKELGRQAMHLILKQIREQAVGSILLDAELIVRDSTGKAPY